MSIGAKIRQCRKDAGLGVGDAAAAAGMTRVGLWKIETGRTAQPLTGTLKALAQVLDADVAEWLSDEV